MKNYAVCLEVTNYEIYHVSANNEDDAYQEVMSGQYEPVEVHAADSQFNECKEI